MGKRNALLSVYDKTGIIDFAKELVALDFNILASGGTARALAEAGIPVQDVASLVGGEAILGHRVVTLSRRLHAGLLSRDIPEDNEEMEKLGIPKIDLVCVNLYPLLEEIEKPEATRESVIEKTDIGGPTMIRSAAKGRRPVICDPNDYQPVIEWLKAGEPDKDSFITALVAKAEFVIADYCVASARYHSKGGYDGIIGEKTFECKYGENGHQKPAEVYKVKTNDPLAISKFDVIEGQKSSYNNICDIDRLTQTITHVAATFDSNFINVPFIAAAVKHGNPCGVAFAHNEVSIVDVIHKVVDGDPLSIFGGWMKVTFPIRKGIAKEIIHYKMPDGNRRLLDGIIAPAFSDEAIEILKRKGSKCRLVTNSALENLDKKSLDKNSRFRYIRGGFLKQPNYTFIQDFFDDNELVKYGQVDWENVMNLMLAKAICDTSNSNTITIVKNSMLIGNGVGQQARVKAAELAIKNCRDAKHDTQGAVAASDSFFPFNDAIEVLINAGIKAIIATSGSVNDSNAIALCQERGVALYLYPDSKGRGFFGH
jgi:phosphoribosylaminoimidazolecarboxamide formyltransferase/IMP cyclohydrolase